MFHMRILVSRASLSATKAAGFSKAWHTATGIDTALSQLLHFALRKLMSNKCITCESWFLELHILPKTHNGSLLGPFIFQLECFFSQWLLQVYSPLLFCKEWLQKKLTPMAAVYQVRCTSVGGTVAGWRNLELSPLPLSNAVTHSQQAEVPSTTGVIPPSYKEREKVTYISEKCYENFICGLKFRIKNS